MKRPFKIFAPRWSKRGTSTLEYVAIVALVVLIGSILYMGLAKQEQPLMQIIMNAINGEGGAGSPASGGGNPESKGNGSGDEKEQPSNEKSSSPPKKEEGGGFWDWMGDRWNDVKDFTESAWDGTKEFVGSVWDDAVDYVTDTGKGGLLDDALDTVGVTSAYEFITGKDWYTGEELSFWDSTGGAIIDFIIAKKAKKVGKGLGYLDKKLLGGTGTKFVSDVYQFGSKKLDNATSALKKKLCNCKLEDQIKSLEKKLSKSEGKGHGDPTEKSIRRKKEKLEKEKKYLEKEKEKAKREEERKKKKQQWLEKHSELTAFRDRNGDLNWRSPNGLIYGQGSKHGDRRKHVLEHTKPDKSKPKHSVFIGEEKEVFAMIDEAWSNRGTPFPSKGRDTYVIDMGRKIGTKGEKKIKIVVERGTSEIVTAYPVR
ncbi:hypothetical protein HMPREF9374_2740 [Desmospora sp. 8437]|nr:hypothetical protein HMPREF9374_2740 [Desmospora sp. 8437]